MLTFAFQAGWITFLAWPACAEHPRAAKRVPVCRRQLTEVARAFPNGRMAKL